MSEDVYRQRAREWLLQHCPADLGSPQFEAVTQQRYAQQERYRVWQRAQGNKPAYAYSSCGDLAHAMLWDLGVRSWWINRQGAGRTWRVGQNVTLLCASPMGRNPVATRVLVHGEWPQLDTGDVLVVNAHDPATTHVSVVLEANTQPAITTCDYGQPHGRVIHTPLTRNQHGQIMRGARILYSVLNLADVLLAAEAAGELLDIFTDRDPHTP